MIEDVRLVICDIDGTLVNSDFQLTPKTKEVIDRLHANGVYFGIASGRSIDQQLNNYAIDKGFDYEFEVIIGMNGSELWDGINMKRYDYYKLKKEWIKEIIELMDPFDLNPFIYYGKKVLCKRADEEMLKSVFKNNSELMIAEDVSMFYEQENAKVMYRTTEEKVKEIEKYLEKHPSSHYKGFKTQKTMIEFSDKRVAKDVALINFCKLNNISLNQVMAFGDLSNDIEMLQASGWGVCLKNGTDDTKAISDDVTEKTNDEDGFAHYVEKHVLSKHGW